MPPSNSPTHTPIASYSLPPLVYYFPPAEPSDEPRNPTSHPQLPDPHDSYFPNNTSQPTPLLPLPPQHAPSYGQLPPPNGGSDSRLRRRRGSLRDADPRDRLFVRDQAYGPRVPSLLPGQRQTLYDWAPAPTGHTVYFTGALDHPNSSRLLNDEEASNRFHGRLRQSPTPPSARRPRERQIDPPGPAVAAQDNSSNRPTSTPSLRRYFRQHVQRQRSAWAGYTAEAERDRERARQRDRERELRAYDEAVDAAVDASWLPPMHGIPFRRMSSPRQSHHLSSKNLMSHKELEETLQYLSKLRGCSSVGESLRLALTSGFTRESAWLSYDGCDCTYDDFLLDTRMLKTPETSWLNVGGTFWGSQTTLSSSSSSEHLETYSPNRWTVKVNISGVDYENMRLNGTMEAYADWARHSEGNSSLNSQNNSGSGETKHGSDGASSANSKSSVTSITTYLEGEIIDFKTHTLKTTSYKSTITDDTRYWRKLEPFVLYDSEVLVQSLTSKSFMKKLMEEYVLMRWKEKCFINSKGASTSGSADDGETATSAGVGGGGLLTIGGFYFVSMRRKDGHIRGFYYDPKSSPYQELVLRPKKRVFPTYEFR